MILLSDERIAKITCFDNKEKIISLRQKNEKILIDETRSQIGNKSDLFCYARESVVKKLIEATNYLPYRYQLLIKEAYRPLSLQKRFFEDYFGYYKNQYPLKNDDEIYEVTCQYVAPIKVAGHPTGGAIDITLLKDGKEIDMGSGFNDAPIEPENLTFLYSDYINDIAKANREILIQCMEKVGFINYPTEWWHWSYGDCYWAFLNNCDALYSATDENEININSDTEQNP
jgi:zinc D-Ala-D-Ala dipeptidase